MPPAELLLGVDALDDDAIVKRTKLHDILPKILNRHEFSRKETASDTPGQFPWPPSRPPLSSVKRTMRNF